MQKTQTSKIESDDSILTVQQVTFLRNENARLRVKIEIMIQLSTTSKFYRYFFKKLRDFETNKQCFDYVNSLYYDSFGVWRYASYGDFRIKLIKHGK